MLKIVDGIPFIGRSTDSFRVKAHDLGHGHTEVVVSRVVEWCEADWSSGVMADHLEVCRKYREEHPEEIEERNRKRAARRARTAVRRLCKAMGATTLLTLTYRANMGDLAVAKAHMKEFNRRVLRVLPSFRCVVAFERQDRGAWHMHIATAGIPTVLPAASGDFRSFNVLRAIWRSVTGELGGNVDVQRRRRHCRKSAAQVAAYIAKYIGKMFEDPSIVGKNRWTRFGAVEVGQPVDLGIAASLIEALGMGYGLVLDLQAVVSARLDRFRDWFFLAAESPPRGHKNLIP